MLVVKREKSPRPCHVYWQSYLQRLALQSTIPADVLDRQER
jgi:hypothetical protein